MTESSTGNPPGVSTVTDEDLQTLVSHLDTVEVRDRIVVMSAPDDVIDEHWFDHESAQRLAEAVRLRGGICVLFLTQGWEVQSLSKAEMLRMIEASEQPDLDFPPEPLDPSTTE